MGKISFILKSALLIILSLIFLVNSQEENMYLKIKAMAEGTYKPESESESADPDADADAEDKISKEDKELYDKTPVFPILNPRFYCENNSEGQEKVHTDVMKNHNYQK